MHEFQQRVKVYKN